MKMPNQEDCPECQMRQPGGFRCRRCTSLLIVDLSDEIQSLRAENAKLREAIRIVDYTGRSRGYPTPEEWEQVLCIAREALKTEGE